MTAPVAEFYPTRSTRHHSARAFRDLADWLASLRLKGRSDRTLDDYERTIAALIEWKDVDAGDYTLDDLVHFVLLRYGATPGARVRMSHLKGFFTFLFIRERIHGWDHIQLMDIVMDGPRHYWGTVASITPVTKSVQTPSEPKA